jgi:membrane-associated protein
VIARPLPTLLPDWLDAETLVTNFLDQFGTAAVFAVAAVIIIETGLLFPFLPGDSLLFTVGLFTGTGQIDLPIWFVAGLMGVAAFIGPQIGYWIGRGVGPKIFAREDSRLFKKSYIDRTHEFFERYGGKAIILAQFVPFVRTYIPVAAGVGKMPYGHFVRFNVIGALIWGVGVTMLGYWLGSFPLIRDNIDLALILVVLVSITPMIVEAIRHRLARRREARTQTAE